MFTGNSRQAYLHWLSFETWHSGHYLDMRRFYRFVNCYVVYARKTLDGSVLYHDLMEHKFDNSDDEMVQSIARSYANLFDNLVEYHKCIRRADWGPLP